MSERTHRGPRDALERYGNLNGCVALERLYDGPLVRLMHWKCLHDGPQLRSERYHDDLVLALPHHGSFRIHSAGRSAMVDPNYAVLHAPDTPYRISHPHGCGDRGVHLVVRRDVAQDLLAELDPRLEERWFSGRPQPVRLLPMPSQDHFHLHLLSHRLRNGATDSMAVEEIGLDLLAGLVRRHGEPTRPRRRGTREDHRHLADTVRTVLQLRFREALSVEEIAEQVHVSPFHLCRVFKRETGLPLHRYRTRLRLVAALDQITIGDDDLSRLALDLGFSNHSHLTSAFHREFGLAPSTVREQARRVN